MNIKEFIEYIILIFVAAAIGICIGNIIKNYVDEEPFVEETIAEKVEVIEYIDNEKLPDPLPEPKIVTYYDIPLDKDLQSYIVELCEGTKIDPAIVFALIDRESTYRNNVIGDGGRSMGLMQIQPKWHRQRMIELGCEDLLDPYQNVTVGIDYLDELAGYGRSMEWVLMAYNGGLSYANRLGADGIVSDYAREIIAESVKIERENVAIFVNQS